MPVVNAAFFKFRGSKSSYFFKLGRQVCNAAVVKFKRDLTQTHFIINKQLFCFFNFLADDELLDRDPFRF